MLNCRRKDGREREREEGRMKGRREELTAVLERAAGPVLNAQATDESPLLPCWQ